MTVPTTSTTLLRDIGSSADNARWGEFVERYQGMMAGYLKPVGAVKDGECEVMIPNHELKQVFYSEIVQKVRSFDKNGGIVAVERALRERDPFLFGKNLVVCKDLPK